MQSSVFAVNDEPYCLWEVDLEARTRTFLEGIDPDYFDYVLQAHTETEDEKRAMVAIRLSLHHATEALFSLLGSFVQAPDCPYAWIAKCSNPQLREFAERVNREDRSLITKLRLPSVSWVSVASSIFETYRAERGRDQGHSRHNLRLRPGLICFRQWQATCPSQRRQSSTHAREAWPPRTN